MYDLCSPLQTAYPVSPFPSRVLWANLTPDSHRRFYLTFRIAYLFSTWWTLTNARWHRNISGLPSSCAFLSTHATLFVNPDRPSENSPNRFLCVGFQSVETVAICICATYVADAITGLYQDFRKCGLPCGLRRSLCTLQWCCSFADGRILCPCFQARWNCCRPFFNAKIFSIRRLFSNLY